jgi:hypothetical protein
MAISSCCQLMRSPVGIRSGYYFAKGKLTPSDSAGARHSFEPTEVVYLRFYPKLSPNWSWTNNPYGPHLLHFMTSTTVPPPPT